MLSSIAFKPDVRNAILDKGFFYGWNWEVAFASFITWTTYLIGSSCVAYISAMAASMGTALTVMCVGLVGAFEGKPITPVQVLLMVAVVVITLTYTYFKDKA